MRVTGDPIADLGRAAAVLGDEAQVLELAVRALHAACPRGVAFGFSTRGDRAQRMGRGLMVAGGEVVLRALPHLAHVRTPAFDVGRVPEAQRNRWVEPFREGIATRESFKASTIYPLVARFGVLDQGRVAVCAGARMVAMLGAAVPEGHDLQDDERARLAEVSATLVAPVRVAAVLAADGEPPDGLALRLDAVEDAVVALDGEGAVLDTSPRAFALLRRDRALPEALRAALEAHRAGRRGRGGRVRIHVTPFAQEGSPVRFLACVDASPYGAVPAALTARQRELLGLVARGLTNPEIGAALGAAPSTVKTVLERLYRRAEVANRIELLAWARAQGLLDAGS